MTWTLLPTKTIRVSALLCLSTFLALAQVPPPNVSSSASGHPLVAPNSLASMYGSGLAAATAIAPGGSTLPTTLGGVMVDVKDANGVSRLAPLSYVSAIQINFVVPDGTSEGTATVTVNNPAGTRSAPVLVHSLAPGIFAMPGDANVAAATAIRVLGQSQTAIDVFQCPSPISCVPADIKIGIDTPIFISLYGTGIRNRSALANVQVVVGGITVPAQYAGAQPTYAGLDQVNFAVPLALHGVGDVDVYIIVDAQISNTVRLRFE